MSNIRTETNFHIVEGGTNLQLTTRFLKVTGQEITPDLLNLVADKIRKRRGLAAVPAHQEQAILVASERRLDLPAFEGTDWYLEAKDTDKPRTLNFRNPTEALLIARLIERGTMSRIERLTKRWVINRFPRTFYDENPFDTVYGISAYRAYEVSCEVIEGVGIGIAIEVNTSFLSEPTVADFFRTDLSREEREKLQKEFFKLIGRDKGKKGLLLYNNGKTKTTCYFDTFQPETTCSTTGKLRFNGESYESLADYYKVKFGIRVNEEASVAKVSFKNFGTKTSANGFDRPVMVCADMLKVKILNEYVPDHLKKVDKITPDQREKLITSLWQELNYSPLGKHFPKLERRFWRPSKEKVFTVVPTRIMFGDGAVLDAPIQANLSEYKSYYRNRLAFLNESGCFDVPPTVDRTLHIAVRNTVSDRVVEKLGDSITNRLSKWTRKNISWNPVRYSNLDDAFFELRQCENKGLVLFVLDDKDDYEDSPAPYYIVANELKDWRVKRLTLRTLMKKFNSCNQSGNGRCRNEWESFIDMNALDVLQQMDCVPWIIQDGLTYPAHLAIDVGENRRHFGISLLICQPDSNYLKFFIKTRIFDKPDFKKETINPELLRKGILTLVEDAKKKYPNMEPLSSLLVFRDGRDCGEELKTILGLNQDLGEIGFLSGKGEIALVDVHKKTVKGFRLWDRDLNQRRVMNTLEGKGVLIDPKTAILNNTGLSTLSPQGTAIPVLLHAKSDNVCIKSAATDFHLTAQFNFTSPNKAQRLALALKRTDDELKNRVSQEISFIK